MLLHGIFCHLQQLRSLAQQFFLGQIRVPLGGRLKQCIQNTCFDPVVRICKNTHPLGDLVCHLKSHTRNIICQLVRIFLHDPVHPWAILVIDLHCQIHGNTVLLQEDHSLAKFLFLLHLVRNSHGHLLTDALYLRQTLWLLLDDPKRICFKTADDPGCQGCSYTFDRPRTQIALHGSDILWSLDLVRFHSQLFSVDRMLRHSPSGFDHLTLAYVLECSYQNVLFAL